MCGICGYISIQNQPNEEILRRFNDSLIHRGPDAGEIWTEDRVGLGNRRLKILDLSDAGNQPMHSADGRYVMVYNGEIYNYLELQKEFLSDRQLKSGSDTEVVLELYAKMGTATFEKLNGMFALAIYDRQEKSLVLTRDRSGIKPLYFHYDRSGEFYFASEVNAFRKVPGLALEINKAVIPAFLHLGYIPAPHSIYRNLYKLRPGHVIQTDGMGIEDRKYHLEGRGTGDEGREMGDERKIALQLEELLSDAIRLQLRSDVPFGIFLSGGIDSSLLTALATKVSAEKIKTFSIGFKEAKVDESRYAKEVAERLGTEHYSWTVSMEEATELFDEVTELYGEPFADSSAIPTLIVSRKAREQVKVALSGEGGDELFMGYGSYNWARRLSNPMIHAASPVLRTLLNVSGESRNKRAAELMRMGKNTFREGHIFSQESYLFSERELFRLTGNLMGVGKSWFGEYVKELEIRGKGWSAAECQSHFDLHYYLPDDLLVKVDRASMHYGLEARVPYLDPRLLDFADALPEELKWKNGQTKYLLKKILYKYLPEELFRRPKQGFTIPLDIWLKDRWEAYISEFLNREVIEHYGVVRYEEVEILLRKYQRGDHQYYYNRIWVLITLHRWLVKFHG